MKKYGGVITNYQIHNLTMPNGSKAQVFTGTVAEDPTGRFRVGNHMRSSLIVNIDKEAGTIETLNTIYKVQEEGGDVFGDLGNLVSHVYY
jgi:hypothetical protein